MGLLKQANCGDDREIMLQVAQYIGVGDDGIWFHSDHVDVNQIRKGHCCVQFVVCYILFVH